MHPSITHACRSGYHERYMIPRTKTDAVRVEGEGASVAPDTPRYMRREPDSDQDFLDRIMRLRSLGLYLRVLPLQRKGGEVVSEAAPP